MFKMSDKPLIIPINEPPIITPQQKEKNVDYWMYVVMGITFFVICVLLYGGIVMFYNGKIKIDLVNVTTYHSGYINDYQ